jgi:exosortase
MLHRIGRPTVEKTDTENLLTARSHNTETKLIGGTGSVPSKACCSAVCDRRKHSTPTPIERQHPFILQPLRYNRRRLNLSLTQTQPVTFKGDRDLLRTASAIAAVGVLWFILVRHLSNEWSVSEQYNYGWFVPFFAAYLFWLRWQDRPDPRPVAGRTGSVLAAVTVVLAFATLFPLRLFEIGNPDWRPLEWLHAAIAVFVTLALIWKIGGKPWLRHFAFPLAFIFVAVPWVAPIEVPIVQGLMRVVAFIASETLNLCGIPARLEGSVIRLNTGLVGVNEACSGVRSLQTSLMIGLLFGELKRLSIPRRLLLVFAAAATAFVANCIRTFFLVWIAATRGLPSEGQWHDVAGYAIVAATFLVSLGAAALLSHKKPTASQSVRTPQTAIPDPISDFILPTSYFVVALCWLLVLELGVHFWYRLHERERDLVRSDQWTVRWPESAPGFRDVHIDALVQSTLRYDLGRQAAWPVPQLAPAATAERVPICWMSFFRWNPGGTSILRARAHRPDICLPNLGWRQISDHGVRNYPVAGKFALPFRHSSFARNGFREDPSSSSFAEAFFCMREDFFRRGEQQFDLNDLTRPTPSNWMVPERWLPPYVATMWHNVLSGLRNPGQQVLELVFISSSPLDSATVEERFARDIQQIIVVSGRDN